MAHDRHHRDPADPHQLSDAELLALAPAQPEAFGIFYRRHVESVLRFLTRRTASPEIAADLTAETFAQALASSHRFRDRGKPPLAWLLGISRNKLNKTLRRGRVADRAMRRLGMARLDLEEGAYERVEKLSDLQDLRVQLRDALDMLSPRLRDAVLLRVALDLPYREVGLKLGCSEGAARVRVMRGLRELEERLEAI